MELFPEKRTTHVNGKRIRRGIAAAYCLLTLVLGSTQLAFAQAGSGTITGTVSDQSGAVLPKIQVVIRSLERGVEYKTQTTSSGVYDVGFLPPGQYSATVEAQGFKKMVNTGLPLEVGQTMRVDFPLAVGAMSQEVQVQGNITELLKSETSEVGQVIEQQQVQDLPLNGRSFTDLITLNAGVETGPQGAANSGYNFNGGRTDTNMFLVEGVDNINIRGNLLLSPSIDAIQEFQIQTGNFSAEYGRTAGGVVEVQLRSGTNKLHGTVFEFLRNDKLDANGYFNNQVPPLPGQTQPPKQPLKQNQFGFSLGGPIKKDKLFFFGDYQGTRQRQGTSALFSVPTADERQGNFAEVLPAGQPIYQNAVVALFGLPPQVYPGCNPANFTPQTCQVIPATGTDGIDKAAANVSALYPLPNTAGLLVPGVGYFDNYAAVGSGSTNVDSFDVKMDYHPRDPDSFSFRYSFANSKLLVPAAWDGGLFGPCINCGVELNVEAGGQGGRNQNVGATYVHTFSPVTVNEFRAGLNRAFTYFNTSDNGQNLADQLGIPNVNVSSATTGLPWLYMTSGPDWTGTSPFEPWRNGYTAYQLADKLSHLQGKHSIKIGVDLRRRLNNGVGNGGGNFFNKGEYAFVPLFTGVGYGDFLTGRPAVIAQDISPGTTGYRGIEYGFYAQDDIKVMPRFTLNLGIRYDIFPGFVEVHNRIANLDPAAGIARLAGQNGVPRQFLPTDYHNFAPRLGFAWSPFADLKTVIRGGYGISYFNPNESIMDSGLNPPFTETFSVPLNVCTSSGCSFLDAQYFLSGGLPIQLRTTPANFNPKDPSGSWYQNDIHNKLTPYTQSFSFGVQRALGWDTVLDVSYVGAKGSRLPGQNSGDPTPPGNPSTEAQRAIYFATVPNVSSISLEQDIYSSNYNSLQVKATKRFSHGLQFLASYTYSTSIDDQSGDPITGGGNSNPSGSPQDPFNIEGDRAPSSFNQTHRLTFAFNYNLPFGRGQSFGSDWHPVVDAILGGWQTNGILTLATGLPFSVFATSGVQCGCTSNDMRADLIGDPHLSHPGVDGWFNKAAFKDPQSYSVSPSGVITLGQYGDSERDLIVGPGYKNLDFSLFKKFKIKERAELQFRGEFFNIFNNVNFLNPTSSNDATWNTGGLITLAHAARIGQVALKIVF
jgi:hypothetical protein